MVFSSSASVYGNNPVNPKKEDFPLFPQSPYALSKVDGEYFCRLYRTEYGINAVSLRYFNVFGPRQRPDASYAAVVPVFLERARKHEPLVIYGDGKQTRDFVPVDTVVKANIAAAEKGGEEFNIALGEGVEILALAQMLISFTKSRSEIIYAPARPGDIKDSMADNTKMAGLIGSVAPGTWLDGLKRLVDETKLS